MNPKDHVVVKSISKHDHMVTKYLIMVIANTLVFVLYIAPPQLREKHQMMRSIEFAIISRLAQPPVPRHVIGVGFLNRSQRAPYNHEKMRLVMV